MENHPIPQDVTGFQFKLIGEMTIRQFGYLGGGVAMAWVFLSLPIVWFVKVPLVFIFGFLGVAFAFLPIDGRPLDTMIYNFFKALTTPDQYLYQKVGGLLLRVHTIHMQQAVAQTPTGQTSKAQLETILHSMAKKNQSQNVYDQKEEAFFSSLATLFQGKPTAAKTSSSLPQTPAGVAKTTMQSGPTPTILTMQEVQPKPHTPQESLKEIEKEEEKLEEALTEAKTQEVRQPDTAHATLVHQKVTGLEQHLQKLQLQKQQLEQELITLRQQLEQQKKQVFSPTTIPSAPKPVTPTQKARTIPKDMVKSVGIPFTPDVPNLIVGIVKDPRGNVLPNILVEVKDKDGSPVRAFKTNGVGQFASATAITSGVYILSFEDPRGKQTFDEIQIEAKGDILQPIEVISKDQREELRKSLFNT